MSLGRIVRVALVACTTAPGTVMADQLVIHGIIGGERVVVMGDARTKFGCVNDLVLRSKGRSTMGDLLPAGSCNSEIAIFASRNAMLLEAATWTAGTADQHVSTLAPVIGVPVAVWIVDGPASVAIAQAHVSRANYLYAQNKVGVRFIATFTDVSSDPNISVVLNGIAPTAAGDDFECKDMASLRQSAFYRQNTLNVYYVKLAPTATGQAFTGRNCAIRGTPTDCNNLQPDPDGDGNVTFVNSDANRAVLAHEFGHAFGLRPGPCGGHTNRLSGFAPDNIMWAGGDGNRARFTLGQVFRMNTHADQWGGTMLIRNGLRPGPGRPCPPLASNAQCPSLLIDWTRP